MLKILVHTDDISLLPPTINISQELLKVGNGQVAVVLIGPHADEEAERIKNCGAKTIFTVVETGMAIYPEVIANVLAEICRDYQPDIIIMPANWRSKETAPRLAVKLKTGCINECTGLIYRADSKVVVERLIFGGVAVGKIVFQTKPAICTLICDRMGAGKVVPEGVAEIVYIKPAYEIPRKELVESRAVAQTVDITSTDRIVAVGRGVNKKEDIGLVEELASVLKAELACSRPIAEDFKWLSSDRLVGLTGVTVQPKLYMAIGISGQIQHVIGMKNSQIIVAINNNKQAPIFEIADYAIVGDLYAVIPELIKALKTPS